MLIIASVRSDSCKRYDGDSFSRTPLVVKLAFHVIGVAKPGIACALSACPVIPGDLLREVNASPIYKERVVTHREARSEECT
jgi:hypothetical protein